MLCEIRERKILYDVTYMWNLKNNTTDSIQKLETDSDIKKNKHGYERGEEEVRD